MIPVLPDWPLVFVRGAAVSSHRLSLRVWKRFHVEGGDRSSQFSLGRGAAGRTLERTVTSSTLSPGTLRCNLRKSAGGERESLGLGLEGVFKSGRHRCVVLRVPGGALLGDRRAELTRTSVHFLLVLVLRSGCWSQSQLSGPAGPAGLDGCLLVETSVQPPTFTHTLHCTALHCSFLPSELRV